MKVWISFDMEGVAGVVDWDQCRPGGHDYPLACALLQDEVNAAIEGALAGGATEIVINDSHGRMANLDPRAVAGGAQYIAGKQKPHFMMQGLDESFDAIFFVGYHGSISGPVSNMSHSFNPQVFSAARINGTLVGESGINALFAQHFGVPIALVSGDSLTWEETRAFAPGAQHVVTKESISRLSAKSLHPTESCRLIREAAQLAIERVAGGEVQVANIAVPAQLDLDLRSADLVSMALWIKNTTKIGERTVRIESAQGNLLETFESFIGVDTVLRGA